MKRSSATSGYLVKKSDTSNGYRLWILRHGAVRFEVVINGTTHTVTSGKWIPVNAWRHVCARFNNRKLRVYINGKSDATSFPFNGSLTATTEALWLGYYDAANHHFHGYLDDVSIYHRSLTNGEIKDLWHSQAGRYEYHHTNALGSNIIMTDEGKNVIARYEYDVFGAVRHEVGTSDNTRKFTGKEYESDVKLYYYGARYYDPYTGRFTQRDPAADGINWYAYAYNNPLAFIDPTGMYIVLPGGEIRSVPDLVDGSYVRPGVLSDESGLVWDALFTGGANGTGIAGSNTAGDMLKNIIESDTRVEIQFTEYIRGDLLGHARNWGPLMLVRLDEDLKPSNPDLTITLLHELSHVHDFMTLPQDFQDGQPYQFLYVTELRAYDLEARFAREMDSVNGIYKHGTYSKATNFTERQLTTHYNTTAYYRALNGLARPPGLPYY